MRRSTMRPRRSSAASRDTHPRSTATMRAMMPKPEPPTATRSLGVSSRAVRRSGARALVGWDASQKKLNVWRCTTSSSSSSGSAASADGSGSRPGCATTCASLLLEPFSASGTRALLFCRWIHHDGISFCNGRDSMSRIERLLERMTLAEKLGQLTMTASSYAVTGPVIAGDSTDSIRNGTIGNLLNMVGAEHVHEMQRIAVEQSRLGIPLLIGLDILHGHRMLFPIPLAEA